MTESKEKALWRPTLDCTDYLKLDLHYIPIETSIFLQAVAAFIANPEDPTGLKVSNLRMIVQRLKLDYERMDSLLETIEKRADPHKEGA